MGLPPSATTAAEYAAVLDLLPVATFVADTDGVVTFRSKAWQNITGLTLEESIGVPLGSLIHESDRDAILASWKRSIASGMPFRGEARVRFGDGSYRWTLTRAVPIRDQNDVVSGWLGTLADTHELHSVEEAMAHAISASLDSARDARSRAEFVERLLESTDARIEILDLEGRIVNPKTSDGRALSLNTVRAEGTDWIACWPQHYREFAAGAVATARSGERGRFSGQLEVDGVENWWDVSVTPIRDGRDRPERLLAVSREVTDLLNAHRALAQSEDRYRVLGDALPGLTYTALPTGEIDMMTGGIGNYEADPRMGDLWLDNVHPDDRERVSNAWTHSMHTGEHYEVQKRIRGADGTYRWMLSRARPQHDERGAIVRWIGVAVDIDEQKRADERREQFVRLADASDDFVIIADLERRINYVNAALLRAMEVDTLQEFLDYGRLEFFAPEERKFFEKTIVPSLLREGRWSGDFQFRSFKTQSILPVAYHAFALRDENGRATGLASVSRDMRERRRVDIGMRALAETGAAMYNSLDFDSTLRNVANAVVRTFASYCVVDALNPDDTVRSVAASNRGPRYSQIMELAASARTWKLDHPVWRAIRRGESTLISTIPPDWTTKNGMREALGDLIDELDFRSLLFVPIRSQQDGGIYGSLSCVLDARDPRGNFTVDDMRFAEEIAVRAGLAFDHARAYERERRIAVTLQEASLPQTLPDLPELFLSADYRPGSGEATIGGDWYDAFTLDDGRVAITIGDVLGHGLSAAVTMGKVRQAMQSVATVLAEPSAMLEVADRTVRGQSDDAYATAIAGILDIGKHEFTFASAGHPGPYVRLPSGEVVDHTSTGVLLGMRTRGETETRTIAVPAGSALVFFTDGLTEATRDIEAGSARVRTAMNDPAVLRGSSPAHVLVDLVLAGVAASDDIAVLIAEIGPRTRPKIAPVTVRDRNSAQASVPVFYDRNTNPESRGKIVTIPARLDEIQKVRRAVRALLGNSTGAREFAENVELATGELVANAVEHGSGNTIDVSVRVIAGGAVLAVTNDGAAFERSSGNLADMLLAERGRGLAILTALGCQIDITSEGDRCIVTAVVPFVMA